LSTVSLACSVVNPEEQQHLVADLYEIPG
jgi:hypothetical protein